MTRILKSKKKFESVQKIANEAQKERALQIEHRLDIHEIIEYVARRIEDEPQEIEEPTGSRRTSGPNAETN